MSKACLLLMGLSWSRGSSMHSAVHSWLLLAWTIFWSSILYGLFSSKGWVQVGNAWALCMLQFCACPKLVCCSRVCHGLEARLCVLTLILDFLWCEPFSDPLFFMACFLHGLGLTWLWAFFPFSSLFAPSVGLLVFLPHHSTVPTVVLFDLCLLGLFWACCMLFFYLIMVTHHCY